MAESEAETKLRKQLVNLERLYRNGAFEFTDTFKMYTSGQIGPYFVQSGAILNNGHDYNQACLDMGLEVKDCDIICGGETRDWIFSLPVSVLLEKPHTLVYKNGKIVGPNLKGKKVFWIADLNNEGSSFENNWCPIVDKLGGTLEEVLFYVDRLEDGVNVIENLGLKRNVMVPLDSVSWDYLVKNNKMERDLYDSLLLRLQDKHAWAINMLKSPEGLKQLEAYLYKNEESRQKAIKVIQNYSELTDWLTKKLNIK